MSEIAVIPAGQLTLFDLATIANQEHALAQQAFASTLEHAQRAGEALVEAKTQLRHGEWLPWLAGNFDGSVRTAPRRPTGNGSRTDWMLFNRGGTPFNEFFPAA